MAHTIRYNCEDDEKNLYKIKLKRVKKDNKKRKEDRRNKKAAELQD